MTITRIEECLRITEEFIIRAHAAAIWMKKEDPRDYSPFGPSKERAALRRISMDLTRALAELRKGD